jgi:hypothetical protein
MLRGFVGIWIRRMRFGQEIDRVTLAFREAAPPLGLISPP